MKIKLFTLNSFAKSKGGGNPAGVVLNAGVLSDDQMKMISKRLGFSETAFVMDSDKADFKVRFFTPNSEIDLCGHATIGLFYLLADRKLIGAGKYTQETKAGVLGVEIFKDQTVFMEQNIPEYLDIIDKAVIAESLNSSTSIFINDLPIQIVSTGIRDIFVPVSSLSGLMRIKPGLEKIKEISRAYNVAGFHLFSFETKYASTAHCRNFAPLYDIDEEAATGTSNGALSCYLARYGKLDNAQLDNLVFEQGYSMDRPSEIRARLQMNCGGITGIMVGGTASNIRMREMVI